MNLEEIVVVKTRTGKTEEFKYDGCPMTVPSGKKGIRVSRFIAQLAVDQNALRWDPSTGLTVDSKLYIEDDIDTPAATPSGPLTDDEIKAVKATDGLGDDVIIIDGKIIHKQMINLKPSKEQVRDAG